MYSKISLKSINTYSGILKHSQVGDLEVMRFPSSLSAKGLFGERVLKQKDGCQHERTPSPLSESTLLSMKSKHYARQWQMTERASITVSTASIWVINFLYQYTPETNWAMQTQITTMAAKFNVRDKGQEGRGGQGCSSQLQEKKTFGAQCLV